MTHNPDGSIGVKINPDSAYNASKTMVSSGAASDLAAGLSVPGSTPLERQKSSSKRVVTPLRVPEIPRTPLPTVTVFHPPPQFGQGATIFYPPPPANNHIGGQQTAPPPTMPKASSKIFVTENAPPPTMPKDSSKIFVTENAPPNIPKVFLDPHTTNALSGDLRSNNQPSKITSELNALFVKGPAVGKKPTFSSRKYIAVQDFETEETTDLNFKKGQIIKVTRDVDENW
jgi:hypothetical protein